MLFSDQVLILVAQRLGTDLESNALRSKLRLVCKRWNTVVSTTPQCWSPGIRVVLERRVYNWSFEYFSRLHALFDFTPAEIAQSQLIGNVLSDKGDPANLAIITRAFPAVTAGDPDALFALCPNFLKIALAQSSLTLLAMLVRWGVLTAQTFRDHFQHSVWTKVRPRRDWIGVFRLLLNINNNDGNDGNDGNAVQHNNGTHGGVQLAFSDLATLHASAVYSVTWVGDLQGLVQLRAWGLTLDTLRENGNKAIYDAVYYNRVDMLDEMARWGLTADDARDSDNRALKFAAQYGKVDALLALAWWYGLTSDDARTDGNRPLKDAAIAGHSSVLLVLARTYDLQADDARHAWNLALIAAARNGHCGVLLELSRSFGLTADDARCQNNLALQLAAQYSRLDSMRLLATEFGLTTEDARAAENAALRTAAMAADVHVLRELRLTFQLDANDARAIDLEAVMRRCSDLTALAVVRELVEGFGMLRTEVNNAISSSELRWHPRVAEYLREPFGPNPKKPRLE